MSTTKNKKTEQEVLEMVQKAFGYDLILEQISIKELTEGLFNVAYEVLMPEKAVILKIAPPQDVKVMSYEHGIMKAEVEALRLVTEHGTVPVPTVLFYDDSHSICDTDYFFMDKLEGESFFALNNKGMLTSVQQATIHHEMGRFNREINRIKGTSFGYFGTPEKQGANWKDVFLTMMEEVLKDGENIGISIGMDYDMVRSMIQKAAYTLEEVKEPTFVHWDIWDGNVFIKDGEITGIIDFERALWAEPLMEAYFRRDNNGKEFIEGYGTNLREEAPVRALLYDLYLYLIMIIETKYRMYDNDWQYGYATKLLALSMEELRNLV